MNYKQKEAFLCAFRVIFRMFLPILLIIFILFGVPNRSKACDFILDEGVAWVDERTYYMPAEVIMESYTGAAEVISEGSEGSKWVAFRGSNGMVYEVNNEILGQIGGSEGLDTDGIYLLTMDSNGTKEWYDDTILVVWRDVL